MGIEGNKQLTGKALHAIVLLVLMLSLTLSACGKNEADEGQGLDANGGTGEVQPLDMDKSAGSSASAMKITSPLDARNGVVRILQTDNVAKPTSFGTGSGFGVGVVGEETAVFVTNRHVIWNDETDSIADHIYIMLDDNAMKRMYTTFGDFYDEEAGQAFKAVINPDRLVECEVLYPTEEDPEYPDYAIIRASRKIEGRVALPLSSTDEIEDTSKVWTIGFPGSADKVYNTSSDGKEVFYSAEAESAELFTGTISRRGKMKSMGNTKALTHNAQIDHGNSGGPLVDEQGQVVGINTYGFGSAETSSVGYYCSIYIDYALDKLDELGIPYNIMPNKASKKDRAALEGWGSPDEEGASSGSYLVAHEGTAIVSLNTKDEDFDKKGNTESILLYEYDEYGERTALERYEGNGDMRYRIEYTLDERGNTTKQQEYKPDGSKGEWSETTYDKNGNELSWRSYDEDGVMDAWCDYEYDDEGNPTYEEFHYSSERVEKTYYENGKKSRLLKYDGNIIVKEEVYDANENCIYSEENDKNGNLIREMQYKYDDNGNQTLYTYRTKDSYRARQYTYDEDNNVITEIETDKNGKVLSAKQYRYYQDAYECAELDANGNVKSVEFKSEDNFGHGTYKYDSKGQLINSMVWRYDFNADGYLIGTSYYSDGVLRSYNTYEPTEVKINPNKPEGYLDEHPGMRRREGDSSV